YGGTDLKLKLGVGDRELKLWNPSVSEGNLFFADADSEFFFEDLEPLGSNNFSEVDEALNMTGHNDSVSEVWDPDGDGVAESTKTFSIAGSSKTVPVVNSTSDGTWKTGIMFDSADGEVYTGSEDLVFVTEIQDSVEGKYGIYDYEARVPSALESLKQGVDAVKVYTEIR
ncbi:MAG: hypothetical protein SVS85_04050, partial [Candidatus Nanohaloarchaea archaeon]|nr:hypothetical protein [Candidatus Nanohaloarchaea archaeon]